MSDGSTTSPKKSQFTPAWIAIAVFTAIGVHFVANLEQFLPHHWQTYTSPDGSFSIQLPAKPTIQPTQVPLDGGSSAAVNVITAAPNDRTTYAVTCAENANVGQKPPDQTLDSARDGSLSKIQGTVLTQKRIMVQGYPGLDVQARARGNSLVDLRIVAVGNRIFMIMAVANVEQDREPRTVQRVLDSFKINGT
jgi:hypothetical protein